MQPVSNAGSDIKTMKEEIKEQNQDQESMGGKEERRTNEASQSFSAGQLRLGPKYKTCLAERDRDQTSTLIEHTVAQPRP